MRVSRGIKFLAIILLLALLLRLSGLFQVANNDERCWLGWSECSIWHPPLSQLSQLLFRSLFGNSDWVGRLLIIVVGVANLLLVYLLARRLYNEKTALFAAGLMAIGAYPLLASLQIDIDGSFLLFFYLLTTLLFLKSEETQEMGWIVATGISLGLTLLTKYPGLFIIVILGTYHLLREKQPTKSIRRFLPIILIGLIVFSIFPLTATLLKSNLFTDTIAHLGGYAGISRLDIPLLLVQYLLAMIWIGPIFIGLLALSLARPKKQDMLLWIWIVVIVLFYTFLNKDNFRPLERYFTILLGPLSILAASFISRLNLSKRYVITFIILTILSLAVLMLLNSQGAILPFYPKTGFIHRAISLSWNFLLPITGSSGPVGFYLNFRAIAAGFLLSLFPLLLLIIPGIRKRKAVAAAILALFLAVSLAFNLLVAEEYIISVTSPNINLVTRQVIDYSLSTELKEPVYVFRNYALSYYLEGKYSQIIMLDFSIEDDTEMIQNITSSGGTILVIDFPSINKESTFWHELQRCDRVKTFEDKRLTLGYVYRCS